MNKTDLETVANLIIDEEFEKANTLINKIMNEETKRLYKQRLIEDGDLTVEPEESEDTLSIDTDGDDTTVTTDDESEEDSTTASEDPESSKEELNYQFNDIQSDIERLRAEFNKIMDIDTDTDSTEEVEEDVYDDQGCGGEDDEASPLTYANECEEDEADLAGEQNIFDDSDLDGIAESLDLSTVKVDLNTPKEAGDGKNVKVDTKSYVSTKEGDEGTPIKITSSGEPKGTGREPSPKVVDSKIKSTNTMDLKPVSKEGDKSAKLNSNDGFGKQTDEDSPLSKIKR